MHGSVGDYHWGSPFCTDVPPTAVTFDGANSVVHMVTRELLPPTEEKEVGDYASCLWQISLKTGVAGERCTALPDLDEKLAFEPANTLVGPMGPRLGQQSQRPGQPNVRDIADQPFRRDVGDGRSSANYGWMKYKESGFPFLVVPTVSGDYVTVLRSIGVDDIIATVLTRVNGRPSFEVSVCVCVCVRR